MPKKERRWVWVRALTAQEKADIATTCERFIAETLKPRFLPEVRPSEFNYPVDITGRWRGSKYSFFDTMWRRHTGQWWCVHRSVTLEEALRLIETDPVLQPHT